MTLEGPNTSPFSFLSVGGQDHGMLFDSRIVGRNEFSTLSDETPVLDQLEGIYDFRDKIVETIGKPNSRTDLFIIGRSHDGKETIAGQLLYRIFEKLGDSSSVDTYYLSTSMALDEAAIRGKIGHSGRGDNSTNEFYATTLVMDDMLQQAHAAATDKPQLNIVETIATSYPYIDLGFTALKRALERAENNENYNVFVLYVIGTKEVQELASGFRQGLAKAKSPKEAEETCKNANVQLDESIGDVGSYNKSWGNEMGRQLVNKAVFTHAVDIQQELREFDVSLPFYTTESLEEDSGLCTRVLKLRAEYLQRREFNMPEKDFVVVVNDVVPPEERKKIRFYRRLIRKYQDPLKHLLRKDD